MFKIRKSNFLCTYQCNKCAPDDRRSNRTSQLEVVPDASYSIGLGFKFRSADHINWLNISVVSSSLSKRYLKTSHFTILYNSPFTSHPYRLELQAVPQNNR